MKNKVRIWATLVGLIIGAISYWFQPYNQLEILGSFIPIIWSAGTFFVGLVFMFFLNEKPYKIAMLIFLGVVLAVMARILYDTIFWDKTSHNLAPFEILLCGIITIPSAFLGVYLTLLFKKVQSQFNK